MITFKPNASDPQWERFEGYLQQELQAVYERISQLGLPPAETEQARGKAAFIKSLLNLKTTPVQMQGPSSTMDY